MVGFTYSYLQIIIISVFLRKPFVDFFWQLVNIVVEEEESQK